MVVSKSGEMFFAITQLMNALPPENWNGLPESTKKIILGIIYNKGEKNENTK